MSAGKKVARTVVSFLLLSGLATIGSSCGYDGQFRYPCQDPAKWETPPCQPPQCEASGTCPEMIFGSVPE